MTLLQEMLQEHVTGSSRGKGTVHMSTVTTGAIKVQFHKCLQRNLRALLELKAHMLFLTPKNNSAEAVTGDNYYSSAASVTVAKQCKVHTGKIYNE